MKKNKKLLAMILSVLMLTLFVPTGTALAVVEVNPVIEYTSTGWVPALDTLDGSTGTLTINSSETAISANRWALLQVWLYRGGGKDIRSLDLSGCTNLTEIGDNGAGYSTKISIKSISLPEKLEKIGGYAFYNFDISDALILPESVNTLGGSAFSQNENLTSINMQGVSTIGQYAFAYSSKLSRIDAPALTSIGEGFLINKSSPVTLAIQHPTPGALFGANPFVRFSGALTLEVPANLAATYRDFVKNNPLFFEGTSGVTVRVAPGTEFDLLTPFPTVTDNSKSVTATIDADYVEDFAGGNGSTVSVNGTLLKDGTDLSHSTGSVNITLLPSFLKTLKNGSYPVVVNFANGGYATATLNVQIVGNGASIPGGMAFDGSGSGGAATPRTGDYMPLGIMIGLLILSGAVLIFRRKELKN